MKTIWHSINGYTKPVQVVRVPSDPMGENVLRIVGDPNKDRFRMSHRHYQVDQAWTFFDSKYIRVADDKVPEYIHELQSRDYRHAGKVKFPTARGKIPAGQYDEYRLELAGVIREAFLKVPSGFWRVQSWNYAALRRTLADYRKKRQAVQKYYSRLPPKGTKDVVHAYRRARNGLEPLFRYFVVNRQGSPLISLPGRETANEKDERTLSTLGKILTDRWPSVGNWTGRPAGESPEQKRLTARIYSEYRSLKKRRLNESDSSLAREIHAMLSVENPPINGLPSTARVRNIIVEKKKERRNNRRGDPTCT